MTQGHKEGQALFEALGRQLGFDVARSFTRTLPTDGVWYAEKAAGRFGQVPLVAIEVLVSESRKTIRGSLMTLELVSPALGILLVHEEEIRRRLIRAGFNSDEADARVLRSRDHAEHLASASRQRVEAWSFADLVRHYRRATGSASLWRFGTRPPEDATESAALSPITTRTEWTS
jgi:hypothetical protein